MNIGREQRLFLRSLFSKSSEALFCSFGISFYTILKSYLQHLLRIIVQLLKTLISIVSELHVYLDDNVAWQKVTERNLSVYAFVGGSALLFPVCSAKPIERERCLGPSNELMGRLSMTVKGGGPREHCPCVGDLQCQPLG